MGNHSHQDVPVNQLFKALTHLKKVDDRFPVNAAITLLYIHKHNPCLKQDMENALGFNSASGSRNTDYLSKINRLRKPGLDFITKVENPDDRRQTVLTLTKKGEEFVNLLLQTNGNMEGGC